MLTMNSSNSIAIPVAEDGRDIKKDQSSPLLQRLGIDDLRKLIHAIKVGIALVLVSLLYCLETLYNQVGDNAMWAIMTVVVVFEFTAGAMLSKGLNRGMGTLLGAGLGSVTGIMAQNIGGSGRTITIGFSVFIFGTIASYSRLVPSIKKKYDYGVVIFILTFNLVAISGVREEEIIKLASARLSTIGMGFAICLITSLLIYPIWAGDELHRSLVSKFNDLALSLEEVLEEYCKSKDENIKIKGKAISKGYISVFHSKSLEETLANFARWEPWHGKFGFHYPWNMYLKIGDKLRQLAASILSSTECLESYQKSSLSLQLALEEPCVAVGLALVHGLRELGDSICNMKRCKSKLILGELRSAIQALTTCPFTSKPPQAQGSSANEEGTNEDALAITSFTFLLMKMGERVEDLIKTVEELGDLAHFPVD